MSRVIDMELNVPNYLQFAAERASRSRATWYAVL